MPACLLTFLVKNLHYFPLETHYFFAEACIHCIIIICSDQDKFFFLLVFPLLHILNIEPRLLFEI